jgi:MFS family permease
MTIQGGSRAAALAAASLVATLISIYVVSQFLRNSIGVIAPNLADELSLSPVEIGFLSSTFFLVFASVQIPVGMALDRFGPRRCLLVGAAVTVLGILVFATAATPAVLIFGRALLGLGTAGSLVSSLAVYARRFPPGRFAMLTGLQVGIGTFGTLLATAPLAYGTATIGWRSSFLAVGAFTLLVGILVALVVDDKPVVGDKAAVDGRVHAEAGRAESFRESLAGILAVLRTPSVARLFAMNLVGYSTFGLVAGLWGGPYLAHVYGLGLEERGSLLVIPVLGQIVGSVIWGPADRLAGSYKLPVLAGALATATSLAFLALAGRLSMPALVVWLAAFGFLSAFGPVLIAHGKALFAPHQVGRGLTVLNMGSMGGTFLSQSISGYVIGFFPAAADGAYELTAYRVVFALQALFILLACLAYFGARDPAQRRRSSASNA